jgi:hypothetical protein
MCLFKLSHTTNLITIFLMFRWPYIIVYQYNETNVMHFSFSLLRIKGLYMFRALLAHPQDALHKRQLIYCVRIMSVGCGTVLETCRGPLILNKLNETCITLVSLYRLITTCSRIFIQSLVIPQLFRLFPAFYGNRSYVNVYNIVHHFSMFRAKWNQATPSILFL